MPSSSTDTTLCWFPSLRDVPGVEFVPVAEVDREQLRYHDLTPTIVDNDYAGRRVLSWATEPIHAWDRSTASPVVRAVEPFRTNIASSALSLEQLVDAFTRAVELPGSVADFHWALERAQHALWMRSRREPDARDVRRTIALADVRLAYAYADDVTAALTNAHPEASPHEARWQGLPAVIGGLVEQEKLEGRLHLARDVARIACRFLPEMGDVADELTKRTERLPDRPRVVKP